MVNLNTVQHSAHNGLFTKSILVILQYSLSKIMVLILSRWYCSNTYITYISIMFLQLLRLWGNDYGRWAKQDENVNRGE